MKPPPDIIDLRKGSPAPELLPTDLLAASFNRVISNSTVASKSLDYGPGAGDSHVRSVIAEWLSRRYSLSGTRSERVAVTGGASQNLDSILQCYTSPEYTQVVYLVAPTYHLVCDIFEDHGYTGRLRAIAEDEQGLDIDLLDARMRADSERHVAGKVRFRISREVLLQSVADRKYQDIQKARSGQKLYSSVIYCVPSFSNPSGTTMTTTRREELVRLARRHDALIISDDVYDFLNWGGCIPLPRLTDIDAFLDGGPATCFGNTVSNGSFSKLLGPGLRTGWADATPAFIHGLSLFGSSISGGPPGQFTSWLAAASIASGSLDRHIDSVLQPALQRKSQAMLDVVNAVLVPLGVEVGGLERKIEGGYFLRIQLPSHVDSRVFCDRAEREMGLLLAPGTLFAVHGDEGLVSGRDFVRLCFAYETESRLVEGVQRIATLLTKAVTLS